MDDEVVVDEAELKEGFEVTDDEVVEDELPVDVDIIDPLAKDPDDGTLGEEEDEEAAEFAEYLFGDDANAM